MSKFSEFPTSQLIILKRGVSILKGCTSQDLNMKDVWTLYAELDDELKRRE